MTTLSSQQSRDKTALTSWDLHLRVEKKSAKAIRTYLEVAQWFAAEYLAPLGFTESTSW